MAQPKGYMGKILCVDLTSGELREDEPGEEIYRQYLGGYGLGVYYIYSRIKPGCDPLGPDNILGFCPGLFTGTPAPFTGRYMVCGKSPLTGRGLKPDGTLCTGGWGDANSGGSFGPALRNTGYDAIFFTGASEKPVYLLIDGDRQELKDASDLWGKDVVETEKVLLDRHGKGFNVAAIGQGGENQVLYAGIVNDRGRVAARSGLGAVVGSKKLKALCLKGNKRIAPADKEKVIELAKAYNQRLKKDMDNALIGLMLSLTDMFTAFMRWFHIGFSIAGNFPGVATLLFSQMFHRWGTPFSTIISHETGDTPLKNYQGTLRDFPKRLSKALHKNASLPYKVKAFGCFSCPIQCGAILNVPQLPYADKETHRPEYETVSAFGGLILNNDYDLIYKVNEYLNRTGVDTISAGGVVAYALECVEKGLLKKEDFRCSAFPEGFLPQWGRAEYILPLLEMIVKREGIGDILALGTKAAAERIPGSAECAVHSRGQELPMHEGRLMKGLMLTYAADPTPGRHTAAGIDFLLMGSANHFAKGIAFRTGKTPEKKGQGQAQAAKFKQAFNSVGFCEFSAWFGWYPLWEMFKALTGWDMGPEEFLKIGWRIQTLRQLFNAREGAIRHEVVKRALGDPPHRAGVHKNVALDMEPFIQVYYEHIGFREDGVPREETLRALGLWEMVAKDLPQCTGRQEILANSFLERKRGARRPEYGERK